MFRLINNTKDDLGTAFLIGITDALKREGLENLVPDTYYGHALDCITRWKKEYPDTYDKLVNFLSKKHIKISDFRKSLKNYPN